MIKTWRLVKKRHAETAFDGEGARLHGGRWNSPGSPVVYTSASLSLAALETLVYVQAPPVVYVAFSIEFHKVDLQCVPERKIPSDWKRFPASASTREIGDAWVRNAESLALRVPSVLVPSEHNFLLNPNHPRFHTVRISPPVDFSFDPRLVKIPDLPD